jgi:hypothetical protein
MMASKDVSRIVEIAARYVAKTASGTENCAACEVVKCIFCTGYKCTASASFKCAYRGATRGAEGTWKRVGDTDLPEGA